MHRASLRLAMGASLLCGATAFPAAATGSLGSRILLGPPRSPSHRASMMTTGRAAEDGDEVQKGSTDRSHVIVFKEKKTTAHNGELINCRGLGTCGTCAVEIKGAVSPTSWNAKESLRLNFPPHASPGNQKLRLACQVRIEGDLQVTKYDRFWGEGDVETTDRSFSVPFGEWEYLLDSSNK